jgi:hypothetical protein
LGDVDEVVGFGIGRIKALEVGAVNMTARDAALVIQDERCVEEVVPLNEE